MNEKGNTITGNFLIINCRGMHFLFVVKFPEEQKGNSAIAEVAYR
jgi:hypothetical protein